MSHNLRTRPVEFLVGEPRRDWLRETVTGVAVVDEAELRYKLADDTADAIEAVDAAKASEKAASLGGIELAAENELARDMALPETELAELGLEDRMDCEGSIVAEFGVDDCR
ncbi:BQ5605_C009g05628 [Microbotryum silenes-dioicae]|uniref:BQ5605_C009g05628 protein n=1 Tax=Microbotryum silenes-dioicae TaxID=796604 RepID=A0A2X0N7F4_9BASI|nr:BQ5605_C009g05628 [Microbotryum silenes-dioicae]